MAIKRAIDLLVDQLMALTDVQIRAFLQTHGLPRSGDQGKLREGIERGLQRRLISRKDIVTTLDKLTPWGKQHVYLYDGPVHGTGPWAKKKSATNWLKDKKLIRFLNKSIPVELPKTLTLTSIAWKPHQLRITAVKRRDKWNRVHGLDKGGRTKSGEKIQFRAHVLHVIRGLACFEWDLVANQAFLQVTQLPAKESYEKAAEEFAGLVSPWLDLSSFSILDLRSVLQNIRKREEAGKSPTEIHRMRYRMPQGHSFTGSSPSKRTPLLNPAAKFVFNYLEQKKAVPGFGDYYRNDGDGTNVGRPHIAVVAEDNRLNFMTPGSEQVIRDALDDVRQNCQ